MDFESFVKETPVDENFAQIFILFNSDRYSLSNFIECIEQNSGDIDTIRMIQFSANEKIAFIRLRTIEINYIVIRMMEAFNAEIKGNGPAMQKRKIT